MSTTLTFTLRALARSGQWTTDRAIAAIAGVDPADPHFVSELGSILDRVNRAEDAAGRPLLSAVVVTPATGLPDARFFAYARQVGAHVGLDDRGVWKRELQRVHDYWARH